jgi:hypothetical protein
MALVPEKPSPVGIQKDPLASGFTAVAPGALGAGVVGISSSGPATASPDSSTGVYGLDGTGGGLHASTSAGVFGESANGNGVCGSSANWNGVEGDTGSAAHAGVAGVNRNGGPAIWGQSSGNAGEFQGNVLCSGQLTVGGNQTVSGSVTVKGDIFLPNQDCAEDFDVAEPMIDGGTVVVINASGSLQSCTQAYDKRVAGVVSGAGDFRPAITLGRQESNASRMPVALLGKVYCKVDANYSPVEVGDLLTTSPTPGHAMKAAEPVRAFGSVIGKALRSLEAGQGLIPILIALQ